MDRVVDYDLAKGDTEEDLLIAVRIMIRSLKNKGTTRSWKPQGGVCVVFNEKGEALSYHQAMVLIEEEEVKDLFYNKMPDIQHF